MNRRRVSGRVVDEALKIDPANKADFPAGRTDLHIWDEPGGDPPVKCPGRDMEYPRHLGEPVEGVGVFRDSHSIHRNRDGPESLEVIEVQDRASGVRLGLMLVLPGRFGKRRGGI